MSFDTSLDFLMIARPSGSSASAGTVPPIDAMLRVLGVANVLGVTVSTTAPTVNQSTTIWLQPQTNSWAGNGTVHLWDPVAGAYAAATPQLFSEYVNALLGAAVIIYGAGVPGTATGRVGQWYARSDAPGGIYRKTDATTWTILPGTGDAMAVSPNGTTAGTATAATLVHTPAWTAIPDGAIFPFTFANVPTGAAITLQVDSIAAAPLRTATGATPFAGQFRAGEEVLLVWNATVGQFRIMDGGSRVALYNGGTVGGTADALTASAVPTMPAAVNGDLFTAVVNLTNATTTPTLSVDGLAAATMKRGDGTAIVVGDLVAGHQILCCFDGAAWRVVQDLTTGSPVGTAAVTEGVFNGRAAGGSAQATTVTASPTMAAYTTNDLLFYVVASSNTAAAPTVAVSGLAARTIVRNDGAIALAAGDLAAGHLVMLRDDGTNYRLMFDLTTGAVPGAAAAAASPIYYAVNTFGGTANALTASAVPAAPAALTAGAIVVGKIAAANTTTAPTMALNGGTVYTIKRGDGATALAVGDLAANAVVLFRFDGANMCALSDLTNGRAIGGSSGGVPSSWNAVGAYIIGFYSTNTTNTVGYVDAGTSYAGATAQNQANKVYAYGDTGNVPNQDTYPYVPAGGTWRAAGMIGMYSTLNTQYKGNLFIRTA